jgi:hypothetical protein
VVAQQRAELVDWMVLHHRRFKLDASSLHLSVNILDRYCSRARVTEERLRLVGAAAVLLAAKYEDVSPPTARDVSRVLQHSCPGVALTGQADVLAMEMRVAVALAFQVRLLPISRLLSPVPTFRGRKVFLGSALGMAGAVGV